MLSLERHHTVFVLTMRSGENRFNTGFLDALDKVLDEVEGTGGAAALVTTGEGKFYSNGLDLDALSEGGAAFVARFQAVLERILALPMPTVAAINGHAFAGGGMLALAHDFRVMRADRGYFCLPEVDIGLPFAPGMQALIQAKLGRAVCVDLMLTGRRVGGPEAAALRVVDEAVDADQVLASAIARAESLAAKAGPTYGAIKAGLFAEAIRLMKSGALV